MKTTCALARETRHSKVASFTVVRKRPMSAASAFSIAKQRSNKARLRLQVFRLIGPFHTFIYRWRHAGLHLHHLGKYFSERDLHRWCPPLGLPEICAQQCSRAMEISTYDSDLQYELG